MGWDPEHQVTASPQRQLHVNSPVQNSLDSRWGGGVGERLWQKCLYSVWSFSTDPSLALVQGLTGNKMQKGAKHPVEEAFIQK